MTRPLDIMLSAVGCMLLIGCLNVANLLVARGAARQKEVAIRSALGAQRATLIREQLMESVLICGAGGLSGILLSVFATRWLAHAWKDLPTAQSIHMDGAVIAFACALMCASALAAGLLPALSTTGKGVMIALQTSARTGASSVSRTGMRKSLLTVEIGITVVLLIAAGLLLKSFLRLRSANVGCVTENTLTLKYSLPKNKYDAPEKVNAFNEALLRAREKHAWDSGCRSGKHSSGSRILGRRRIHRQGASPAQSRRRPAGRADALGRSRLFRRPRDSVSEWPLFHQGRARCPLVQGDCEPSAGPAILSRR